MWALRGLTLAIVVAGFVTLHPRAPLWGDGVEYAATLMAWVNHASPDIRAEDLAAVPSPFARLGYDGVHPNMVVTGASGTRYAAHFWLYPLLCAPAALLLRLLGADPLLAFPATNAILFAALAAGALWSRRLSRRDRGMHALAAVTPVVSYLPFAHPEAFTWGCVLASLLAVNHGRYAIAAAVAACGAMQNPPVAALAAFCVVLAVYERGTRHALLPAAAAALCLAPPLFYLFTVGEAAPLVRPGFVDWHLATPARVWSMLTDLDQGLLPFVPGLLVLAGVNLSRARSLPHVGMLCVLVVFIAGSATSNNWSSALAGLMRYAVWVIPLLAWLATEPDLPIGRRGIGLVLVAHAALLAMPAPTQSLHSRLARYALERWPSWYSADPEIFGERTLGLDWVWRERLPLGFARTDGTVAQILTDTAGLLRLDHVFDVDPAYRARMTNAFSRRSGLFYLAPPVGAVRSRCPRGTGAALLHGIRIRARWPDHVTTRRVTLWADVSNDGEQPLCNLGAGGTLPINLGARIRSGERTLADDGERTRGPQMLLPGESLRQAVTLVLPEHTGQYAVDLRPVIEGIGWGEHGASFMIEVSADDGGHYTANAGEAES
jgi:hypothetical protein